MSDSATRILVIDDEPMVRQTFSAFLQHWGYETLEAENGQKGLDVFQDKSVDLVLTDLDMPVMGGLEVLAYLHENAPDTPVVIISGAGQLDDAVQSVKLGAWDYLTKPISNMVILQNTIDRCLEKVQLIRENKMYQKHLEEEVARKTDELRRKNIDLQAEVADRKKKEEEVRAMNRHLEAIIDASGQLFQYTTVADLLGGVLINLHQLLRVDMRQESVSRKSGVGNSFAAMKETDGIKIAHGVGDFAGHSQQNVAAVLSEELQGRLAKIYAEAQSEFSGEDYFGYVRTANDIECVFYLDDCTSVSGADRRLLQIYTTNIASAIDSIVLNEEIVNTQKEVVITLGEVIETRSKESANHVRRVAEFSYLLAKKYGLDEQEAMLLRFASPMHDAGKIGIPDSLLNKPGRLDADELKVMQEHTTLGYEILKGSQRPIMKSAAVVAYEHHERWNGSGYPRGLAGEDIHIYGRIVALADVFDALGSDRCYKKAWELDKILAHIRSERGAHFEPRLVDILLESLNEFLEVKERFPDK